jgi:hypothetical protein
VGLEDVSLVASLQHLLQYLRHSNFILPLGGAAERYLDFLSPQVLDCIKRCGEWTSLVPECVAAAIKQRKLFGYSA